LIAIANNLELQYSQNSQNDSRLTTKGNLKKMQEKQLSVSENSTSGVSDYRSSSSSRNQAKGSLLKLSPPLSNYDSTLPVKKKQGLINVGSIP